VVVVLTHLSVVINFVVERVAIHDRCVRGLTIIILLSLRGRC